MKDNKYFYARYRKILFDKNSRFEKAEKIYNVLKEKTCIDLKGAAVLDIGCSAGLIDYFLCNKGLKVTGIDIDNDIINAVKELMKQTSYFSICFASGHSLPFKNNSFDIVICNIMYCLMDYRNQRRMFNEIYRVLKRDGVCYFSGPNKYLILDAKYKLPFLTWLPIKIAKKYVEKFSKIKEYNEYYLNVFQMNKIFNNIFDDVQNITLDIIDNPEKFNLRIKYKFLIKILSRILYLFLPTYIFLLKKNDTQN